MESQSLRNSSGKEGQQIRDLVPTEYWCFQRAAKYWVTSIFQYLDQGNWHNMHKSFCLNSAKSGHCAGYELLIKCRYTSVAPKSAMPRSLRGSPRPERVILLSAPPNHKSTSRGYETDGRTNRPPGSSFPASLRWDGEWCWLCSFHGGTNNPLFGIPSSSLAGVVCSTLFLSLLRQLSVNGAFLPLGRLCELE